MPSVALQAGAEAAYRELNRTLELNPNHAEALAAKGGLYRELPWYLGAA